MMKKTLLIILTILFLFFASSFVSALTTARATCSNYCENSLYYVGVSDETRGCEYSTVTCGYGCNTEGTACACPDKCSDGIYYYRGVFNDITKQCDYSTKRCEYGCNERATGCALTSLIPTVVDTPVSVTECRSYCKNRVYYHNGVYDTSTGNCEYSRKKCVYGCNTEGTECAPAPVTVTKCYDYCEKGIYYYEGTYDTALEECHYSFRKNCENACNREGTACACPNKCSNGIYYYRGAFNETTKQCDYSKKRCEYGCNKTATKCASAPAKECPNYCSEGIFYYEGVYNTATGECDYSLRKECEYACNEAGTECVAAPIVEEPPTPVTECRSYCKNRVYYHDGVYDAETGECRFVRKKCVYGCNEAGTECASPPTPSILKCHSYCENSIFYYGGSYNRSLEECAYRHKRVCGYGCNAKGTACAMAALKECRPYCENRILYYKGKYNRNIGECDYLHRKICREGCNQRGIACLPVHAAGPLNLPREERVGTIAVTPRGEAQRELEVRVEQDVSVEVSDEGNALLIEKEGSEFTVEQRLGEVVSKFTTNRSRVERVDITVEENKPFYSLTRTREVRFLGIFPFSMQVSTLVDATNLQLVKEIKPWWSFLVTIPEEEKEPEEAIEAVCQVDHQDKYKGLLCPESEDFEPLPDLPKLEGSMEKITEGIVKLDAADSTTSPHEPEVIENTPKTEDLDVKPELPANLANYPKISPTLLAMHNFVANDCLNNPENELCPEERIYYYNEIDGETQVKLKLDLSTLHTDIDKQFIELGGKIIYFNPEKPVFIGTIGIGRLMNLNDHTGVSYISRAIPEIEYWDLVDDATDFVHLDHLYDVGQEGKGVKIAVMDHGFSGYLNSQANGNLPPAKQLHYTNFLTTADNTQTHGRKCAEVVYAVAPEAEMYLYRVDGFNAWDDAIEQAIADGIDILTSSIGSNAYGPATGIGPYENVVKEATDAGILFFQANGNEHWQFYHFDYSNPDDDIWINFAPGDETNHIWLNEDDYLLVEMRYNQWGADGEGDAEDNFDLYVYEEDDKGDLQLLVSSTGNSDVPYEWLDFYAPEDGFYRVAIREVNKATKGNVEFALHYSRAHPEYESADREVIVPASSPEVISVGAVHEGDVLANYTSRGPTMDGRTKPDFGAPSGFVLPAGGNAIFGTSFATPFLAASTAVLGRINFKNHAEIYKILKYMTFYQDKDMDKFRGWGVPNFNHTYNNITCAGPISKAGPYRVYCEGYPMYMRETAYASLQLAPGTFYWNGSNNESTTFTLTDGTKLLLEYPQWNGLFLSCTGKGQPKVFDIIPQEGDSEVHEWMEKAGIIKIGLHNKQGESGQQGLRLSVTNN